MMETYQLYLFYPISSIGPIKILYISQVMSCRPPKLLIKDEVRVVKVEATLEWRDQLEKKSGVGT